MPDQHNKLYLYEALELRAEYDARIKTLKDCLPETKQNRNRPLFDRTQNGHQRPSSEFSISDVRDQIKALEYKRRKLNSAVQQLNFQYEIEYEGDTITLNEALELRKGLNAQLGELHAQVIDAAYEQVIYKEDRDIVEPNALSYAECVQNLDDVRLSFRDLNRKLRAASFDGVVDFQDEG